MNKQAWLWFGIFSMMALGGCRLDPNSLLGNTPRDVTEEMVDSYSVCRERKVESTVLENATGCATPGGDLENLLTRVDTEDLGKVRLTFEKMWDGSFPKINQLQYVRFGYSQGERYLNLTCAKVESPANVRVYECKLDGQTSDANLTYVMNSLELGNENCSARASFRSVWWYPDKCATHNASSSDTTVWMHNTQWPSLQPIVPKTNGAND